MCLHICAMHLHAYTYIYTHICTHIHTSTHMYAHQEAMSSPHPNPVACFFSPFTFSWEHHVMTEKKTDLVFKVMLSVSLSFPSLRLGLQCLSQ